MSMNYFAFFPALVNRETNPNYYDKAGFFANPGARMAHRCAALGGQGMSIISYIPEERQQAALDFIEWFGKEETQVKWAEVGGYTCNTNVLEADAFLNATPYNPAFAETMTFVKDFWNIPEYGALLEVRSVNSPSMWSRGQGTAEEAMNNIANEHDELLREAGYIK